MRCSLEAWLFFLTAGVATASQNDYPEASLRRLHSDMDGNSDGTLTVDEMLTFAKSQARIAAERATEEHLKDYDTNGDGFLSIWEHLSSGFGGFFTEHEDYGNDPRFKRERLTKKKLQTDLFKAADKNRDNKLTPLEAVALYYPNKDWDEETASVAARWTIGFRDGDDDGLLTVSELFAKEPSSLTEEHYVPFKRVDTDGDGLLTLEEVKSYESGAHKLRQDMQDLFDVADKDYDGKLSAYEIVSSNFTKYEKVFASTLVGTWLAQSGYSQEKETEQLLEI